MAFFHVILAEYELKTVADSIYRLLQSLRCIYLFFNSAITLRLNMIEERNDVLLAEDDNDDVIVFELAMKQANIPADIRVAKDGDKLFTMLKQLIPDILFLDIHMPCKDGISCIIEIRRNKDYDHLPVIMYTSHTTDKYIEDSYRNGANMYLMKSKTVQELSANLKRIFSVDWKRNMYFPPKQNYVLS